MEQVQPYAGISLCNLKFVGMVGERSLKSHMKLLKERHDFSRHLFRGKMYEAKFLSIRAMCACANGTKKPFVGRVSFDHKTSCCCCKHACLNNY